MLILFLHVTRKEFLKLEGGYLFLMILCLLGEYNVYIALVFVIN